MIKFYLLLLVCIVSLSCRQSIQPLVLPTIVYNEPTQTVEPTPLATPTAQTYQPIIRQPNDPSIINPTPNGHRELPEIRHEDIQYFIQRGDSLGIIASRYKINVPMLLAANQFADPDLLEVGQEITIPAPIPGEPGTNFKIIPDSELVYGPSAQSFDVTKFVDQYESYLGQYREEVEGRELSGAEIVEVVAQDYSVNPKLLLAVLEYQSGWVTQADPAIETRDFPLGNHDSWRKGLYRQLMWGANNLNRGYYLWEVNGIGGWLLNNGTSIPIDPTINPGTAGVQHLFSLLYDRTGWDIAVSNKGLYNTYSSFFGYPFDYTIEPIIPPGLEQPEMQLPFEPDVDWAFTGGPHGGWGDGSAWAALDFAPGNEGLGCIPSDYWVVAVADGLITRADQGRVIQDLDNDGNEGTGWVVLYMHIESRDRVQAGSYLKAGERIGHPSCEGGYSTGTHTHLARRYNGEWIPADQIQVTDGIPFVMDGWISSGTGNEYDGYLERGDESVEAWEGFYPENTIHR